MEMVSVHWRCGETLDLGRNQLTTEEWGLALINYLLPLKERW